MVKLYPISDDLRVTEKMREAGETVMFDRISFYGGEANSGEWQDIAEEVFRAMIAAVE